MLAQEATDVIIAKIQGEVAQFLALKPTLVRLQANPDPAIQDKANKLMNTQLSLEGALKGTLDTVNQIQSGTWSMGDIISISTFAAAMEAQIGAVNRLAKGNVGVAGGMSGLAVGGLVGLVFIGGMVLMRRRR